MTSRPTISWADLAGARVALWGLGTEGRASLARLRSMGIEPVIVDDRPELITDERVVGTSAGGFEAMADAEVVIKAPGISRRRPEVGQLEHAGVAVVGGLGLWIAGIDTDRVICVTGSKGKSTVTAMTTHLGQRLGLSVFAGGNLGLPPFALDAPSDVDLWAIEVSSYQASDFAVTPPVVAVTSLGPDHLPWHGDVETYYGEKLSMCTQAGARVTVASGASEPLRAHVDLLGPEVRWVELDTWGTHWSEPLGVLGDHNLLNANIARSLLAEFGVAEAADDAAMFAAAHDFVPLEGRLDTIAIRDGVRFVDDGLSTNVLPTIAALDAFAGERVALIAGGFDRDLDYGPLADALAARAGDTLVLTVYSTGPRIQAEIERRTAAKVTAVPCVDLTEAVTRGAEWARPSGVVLLSPAAASFDAFDDYRHRGRVFREAVETLVG